MLLLINSELGTEMMIGDFPGTPSSEILSSRSIWVNTENCLN